MTDTPTNADRVRKLVTDFLVETRAADPEKVTDAAVWADEFNTDSLDQIEIIMIVEDDLGTDALTDAQSEGIRTTGDLIRVVEAKLAVPA